MIIVNDYQNSKTIIIHGHQARRVLIIFEDLFKRMQIQKQKTAEKREGGKRFFKERLGISAGFLDSYITRIIQRNSSFCCLMVCKRGVTRNKRQSGNKTPRHYKTRGLSAHDTESMWILKSLISKHQRKL